jgi:hypothetical protein
LVEPITTAKQNKNSQNNEKSTENGAFFDFSLFEDYSKKRIFL